MSRWRAWVAAGITGLGAWLVLAVWTPPGEPEASICLLRRVLVPCPGCGFTRALALLAKGRWAAAATLHPLVLPLVAEVLVAWVAWGVALATRRSWRLPSRAVLALGAGHLVLFVGLWGARLLSGTLPP